MPSTSHTTRPETAADPGVEKVGQYQATPVTLPDGSITYLITDEKGHPISVIAGVNDDGAVQKLSVDGLGNLHMTHAHALKSLSVVSPGVAYANGVNALCLDAPPDETREIEIVSIWISAKAAGDFYIVTRDLDVDPGSTSNYTFDLVGVRGDGVTDTSDVVWASFFAAQGRGATGGEYHFDCGAGREIYLIAPDIDYNLVISWLDERP